MRAPSAREPRDERLVPREAHAVRADGDAVDARVARHLEEVEQVRVQRRLAAREVDDVELAAVVGDQVVEDLRGTPSRSMWNASSFLLWT